jgi:hypothetical protein
MCVEQHAPDQLGERAHDRDGRSHPASQNIAYGQEAAIGRADRSRLNGYEIAGRMVTSARTAEADVQHNAGKLRFTRRAQIAARLPAEPRRPGWTR